MVRTAEQVLDWLFLGLAFEDSNGLEEDRLFGRDCLVHLQDADFGRLPDDLPQVHRGIDVGRGAAGQAAEQNQAPHEAECKFHLRDLEEGINLYPTAGWSGEQLRK